VTLNDRRNVNIMTQPHHATLGRMGFSERTGCARLTPSFAEQAIKADGARNILQLMFPHVIQNEVA
jgi:hypothetical protein